MKQNRKTSQASANQNNAKTLMVPMAIVFAGIAATSLTIWGHLTGKSTPLYIWMYEHVWAISSTGHTSHTQFVKQISEAFFTLILASIAFLTMILLTIALSVRARRIIRQNQARVHALISGDMEMGANEFLALRMSIGAGTADEFTGIYVLHNVTKDMYYVGQSIRVLQRVTQHLTGHGNGDVYADFKYGDVFTVQTASLTSSGYQSLNDLERDAINAFDAYGHGYNRTRGNNT